MISLIINYNHKSYNYHYSKLLQYNSNTDIYAINSNYLFIS